MSKRNQHVVPHERGWAVKGAGADKATSVHSTQKDSIANARGIATTQKTELLINTNFLEDNFLKFY